MKIEIKGSIIKHDSITMFPKILDGKRKNNTPRDMILLKMAKGI